jgi:hypothetical protein
MGAPDRPLVEGRVMPATDQEPFMLDEARAGVRRDGDELIAAAREAIDAWRSGQRRRMDRAIDTLERLVGRWRGPT